MPTRKRIAKTHPEWKWPIPKAVKKHSPLRKLAPYFWVLEPTYGCNLRCGHCCCRLIPPGQLEFTSEDTWRAAWQIITRVTPTCRVDVCGTAGEPTLHPKILDLLNIGRKTSPFSQIQVTTNGTKIIDGSLRIRDLLDAGANIIYVDMYGPHERFQALAEESGSPWYFYYDKPDGAPSPWTYRGPRTRLVVLQEHPGNWPKSRQRAGLLGTWYNHLDWEAAERFGMAPVTEPLTRRCNQPFIAVTVGYDGAFLLCCQDGWHETAGEFGNVHNGVDGFYSNWLGKRMQTIRRRLRGKDRAGTRYCRRCCITFSRCDYRHWKDEDVNRYWDGSRWRPLRSQPADPPMESKG